MHVSRNEASKTKRTRGIFVRNVTRAGTWSSIMDTEKYILNVHLELFVPCSCVCVLGNNASLSGVCLTSSMLENSSDSSSSSRVLIPTGLLFQIKILWITTVELISSKMFLGKQASLVMWILQRYPTHALQLPSVCSLVILGADSVSLTLDCSSSSGSLIPLTHLYGGVQCLLGLNVISTRMYSVTEKYISGSWH